MIAASRSFLPFRTDNEKGGVPMGRTDLHPILDHGIVLAIYFFGWIGLTSFFDGITNSEQAAHALSEAVLFTSIMAALDLGICALRKQSNQMEQ